MNKNVQNLLVAGRTHAQLS